MTIVDSGDLPEGTIISFHTGTVRRHAQVQNGKAIGVTGIGTEPVRVDLMAEIGSHTFDVKEGQDVYEVPIGKEETSLKLQIRGAAGKEEPTESGSGVSRKLQTALMMRSYLDNHDVLRQMQELLQEMVVSQPEDPVEFMIKRLEMVCKDSQGADYDLIEGEVAGTVQKADGPKEAAADSDSDDGADDGPDEPPPPPPQRKQRQSVSAEAYGAFNERKAYVPKVIAKDEAQTARLQEVLQACWMFKHHTPENMKIILDVMQEKQVEAGTRLIQEGDEGEVMWVIEDGELDCIKVIQGQEKVVKTCKRGDVFGELALLYNCKRAASVVASRACILWELDRETFKAICYEAAQKAPPEYEGFSAPAGSEAAPAVSFSEAAPAVAAAAVAADEEAKADDSDASDDDAPDESAPVKKPVRPPGRRTGVSAEASKGDADDWVPPVYEKTPEERASLSNIIKSSRDSKIHMLFGTVTQDTFEKILDAMFIKKIAKGENVIQQGDEGDYFYIVKKGDFDIFVKKGDDPPKKVFQCGPGFAFGEMALLYTCPRSATITAHDDSEVWSLDRTAFRNLVVRSSEAQFKESCKFLNSCDIFATLTQDQICSLAEVLEEEEFDDDEAIVEQGEKDDKMFILRSGQAVACIAGEKGEIEVKQYSKGEYFGEIALLSGQPRKASVYAVGKAVCFYITRPTFKRILGPLQSFLEGNMDKYAKYQDAMKEAAGEQLDEERDAHEDEDLHSSAKQEKKPKVVRKREKKQEEIKVEKKVVSEAGSEAPPETLADKVAQDFKNPALVTPSDEHVVSDAHMMMFGGVVPGQKFTMDKHIHCRSGFEKQQKGEEDYYTWTGTTKLKQPTDIAVLCQKGQKSASDPTPNQDNFFIHHVGAITMYGVCDGHGPFGHLVSFRLVQTLPFYLSKSEHFGKNWEEALREAFQKAQEDLEEFCKLHTINIEASGAAGSVLVLEEQTVHIAFIGDARVMLGSWNRRDSRMIFCTKDHKPELPEEKARLEAEGSEVREVDEGSWRIYLKGSNFPGLTMSRAFGDTACAGISRVPEYHKFLMQPNDQWYAIVASDGIWEFIEGEDCCNMTSKKLRLKGTRETVEFITSASRKRWAHVCGDYCDDITAVLIQWNAPTPLEGGNNHCLTVRQFQPPSS